MSSERIHPQTHFRQIGAWKMDIGPVVEETTGLRALFLLGHIHQDITIRSLDEHDEKVFHLRGNDRLIIRQIEEKLITLAKAKGYVKQGVRPEHMVKVDDEIIALMKELRQLGVQLPSWT